MKRINGLVEIIIARELLYHRLKLLWLYAMIASYFYCPPIGRLAHVELTDLRIYDIVFIIGLFLFIMPNLQTIICTIRSHNWLRAYFQFASWAAVTLTLVVILAGMAQAIIAAGRLARFIAYGFVHAALLTFVSDTSILKKMTRFFYILIAIQGFISFLQTRGIIPTLWPEYWLYYGELPVGTLGPHHLHMGSIAIIGIALGLALLHLPGELLIRVIIMSSIGTLIYSIFNVESRSGYFGLGVIAFTYVLLVFRPRTFRSRLIGIFLITLGLFAFFYWGREEVITPIKQKWEIGVWSRYQQGGLAELSPSRVNIWIQALKSLFYQPWILLTGVGIQNAIYAIRIGNAAHNNYLHVLIEMGLPGLYLYLKMLSSMQKRIWQILHETNDPFGQNLALGFQIGFITILFLNLFNENFYMQYALFSFTGQLMALSAMAMHPAWVSLKEKARFSALSERGVSQ